MIKVNVKKYTSYPISTLKIKRRLSKFLVNNGITSDAEVSVAIVGEKRMLGMAKKYLNEENVLHSVLSFPLQEIKRGFYFPKDDLIHLGEIIVCYKKVVEEAVKEDKLVEDKLFELVEHGALHLLGVHHD